MKVRHDEGAANHIGPEPCVAVREDVDEASVGEGIGQPLSHEIDSSGCRRCFEGGRQHRQARYRKASPATRRGRRNLACVEAPCWKPEIPRSTDGTCPQGPHREGEEP